MRRERGGADANAEPLAMYRYSVFSPANSLQQVKAAYSSPMMTRLSNARSVSETSNASANWIRQADVLPRPVSESRPEWPRCRRLSDEYNCATSLNATRSATTTLNTFPSGSNGWAFRHAGVRRTYNAYISSTSFVCLHHRCPATFSCEPCKRKGARRRSLVTRYCTSNRFSPKDYAHVLLGWMAVFRDMPKTIFRKPREPIWSCFGCQVFRMQIELCWMSTRSHLKRYSRTPLRLWRRPLQANIRIPGAVRNLTALGPESKG